MGGICGQIGLETRPPDSDLVSRMLKRMAHRGAQTREVSSGDAELGAIAPTLPPVWPAPGASPTGDPILVLDGSIDNASDLAAALNGEGHPVPADAAGLVAMGLRACGPPLLRRLHGSFAAAFHDPLLDRTWLMRDPLGTRPLYLHRTRSRILFASEIQALLADPAVRLELDPGQLRVLLSLGFNPAPDTLLQGIHKMPPGHYMEIERGRVRILSYEPSPSDREVELSFEEAVREYQRLLQRVVRRSARGRTGVLLSGGADSSALVLLQIKEGSEVCTFTAGFSDVGESDDERGAAWQAARALGSVHRERMIDVGSFPLQCLSVARTIPEPVAAGWLPAFPSLMEAAAGQDLTLWSGQGTGVLHGEGSAWRWIQWGEWLSSLPGLLGRFAGEVGGKLGRLQAGSPASRALSAREERERVLQSFFLFDDDALDRLLRAGQIGDREIVRKNLDRWRERVAGRDLLSQALYMRARTHLPDAVYLPAERLAAEHGVTIRFPYTDPELVEWLESLPASYRLSGSEGKRLHRVALAEWVPAEVIGRQKRSLSDAVGRWIRGPGQEKISEWLLGPSSWLPSVLDGVRVRQLIEECSRGRQPIDSIVLLAELELWARETFLGGSR